MKLNIGCGWKKKKGYINIDKSNRVEPDIVMDIENEIGFPENTFDEIYSEHSLEHIRPDRWKFVLNEIARVAKDGCVLHLKLPFDNIINRTNVDHYRTFSWFSFGCLANDGKRDYYSDLVLESLKEPLWIEKVFYSLFPILKYEVEFKFRIVKK